MKKQPERYILKLLYKYKSIHIYRHTFPTCLVRAGVPIQIASTLLGHTDISMTSKYYVDVNFDDKSLAIEHLYSLYDEIETTVITKKAFLLKRVSTCCIFFMYEKRPERGLWSM